MINEEGGIDVEEFRYAAVVDRVATTGTVWLGLTVGCAQCHTHKFDPITHREYYELFAFLNNADEPEMSLPDPVVATTRDEFQAKIEALVANLPNRFPLPEDGDDALTTEEARAPSSGCETGGVGSDHSRNPMERAPAHPPGLAERSDDGTAFRWLRARPRRQAEPGRL